MKRIRIVVLCLVAVFAMSAVAAASASASPTYKECVKVKVKGSGQFTSSTCATLAEPGKGSWELQAPAKGGYTATSKTATLETTGVGAVSCKTSKATGTITSETSATTVVVFASCSTAGKKCTSAGEKAGKIKTFELLGSLREPEPGKVETVLTGNGPEGLSAEFSCEGITLKTRGSVGGVDTGGINSAGKTSTQTFEHATGLETEIVGTPFGFLPSTQTATATVKTKAFIGIFGVA
jgi:hypothetical protein